ncbi:hypothetical protein PIB30_044213 [Stylosanthes scabra]|uniref:Uncharacterized protein n=1 Tax=Stylosanthes scabra TaxID=79078 RepID=A0ABU6TFI5_9FABA|nr:hypothetical protein [Stylosanthes scabra]
MRPQETKNSNLGASVQGVRLHDPTVCLHRLEIQFWLLSVNTVLSHGFSCAIARVMPSHEPLVRSHGYTIYSQMVGKGKEVAFASTPSRTCTTRNSNRGRENEYPDERYKSLANAKRAKTLENQGNTHERIISFSEGEPDFMHYRIEGLGWGFMYNSFIPINMNIHQLIMANIDPRTHATTFLMEHALLIYVLMTEGIVNLPRIMRDVMLKRPTVNSRNLLPYLMFIARLANQYHVPQNARDEIVKIREVDMYCPYGDRKGEQARVRHSRIITPPQAPPIPPGTTISYYCSIYFYQAVTRAFSEAHYEIPA